MYRGRQSRRPVSYPLVREHLLMTRQAEASLVILWPCTEMCVSVDMVREEEDCVEEQLAGRGVRVVEVQLLDLLLSR